MLKTFNFQKNFQAVMRRAKIYGIYVNYHDKTNHPEVMAILKMLINLALLPHHLIEEGLQYIENLAYKLAKEMSTTKKWEKFFSYFRRFWMNKIKPENFSVFDAEDRTNNCLERYHRDLNALLGYHPTVKKFIGNY